MYNGICEPVRRYLYSIIFVLSGNRTHEHCKCKIISRFVFSPFTRETYKTLTRPPTTTKWPDTIIVTRRQNKTYLRKFKIIYRLYRYTYLSCRNTLSTKNDRHLSTTIFGGEKCEKSSTLEPFFY